MKYSRRMPAISSIEPLTRGEQKRVADVRLDEDQARSTSPMSKPGIRMPRFQVCICR